MLRSTQALAWKAQYRHGAVGGSKWLWVKKNRVYVQHLLKYERIEVGMGEAKNTMRTADTLLNIVKAGPATLEELPPREITTNHEQQHDSHSFGPHNAQFKFGGETWAYDHVFESDRRFARTTKTRNQSAEQYTRDMLDWWTEGADQVTLQNKIYDVLIPRFDELLGRDINNYCRIGILGSSYHEGRSTVDGLPAYRGGGNTGGRYGAGVHAGFYGAGNGRQAVLELKGNTWPPIPVHAEGNQHSLSLENVLLQNALKKPTKAVPMRSRKGHRNRRDRTTLKDTEDSIVY